MIDDKQANELAWTSRTHYDKMIDRGFTPSQVAITTIMISISQYILTKGPGAGIAIMTACLNAIMSGEDINITKIQGYQEEDNDLDINFELDGDWLDDDEEEDPTDNIIHVDFTDKD